MPETKIPVDEPSPLTLLKLMVSLTSSSVPERDLIPLTVSVLPYLNLL